MTAAQGPARPVRAAVDPFDPDYIWLGDSRGGQTEALTLDEAEALAVELREQVAIGRQRAVKRYPLAGPINPEVGRA